MLYVKTKVLPSKIQGLGLFADEFIQKGTVIWKFTSGFDLKFSELEIAQLPSQAKKYLETYSYLSKKVIFIFYQLIMESISIILKHQIQKVLI